MTRFGFSRWFLALRIAVIAMCGALTQHSALAQAQYPDSIVPQALIGSQVAKCVSTSGAAMPCVPVHPLGFCTLTISSATFLGSCAGGIPATATFALITIETNAVRWRDDGTAPTSSVGWPLSVGMPWGYWGPLGAIEFMPETGSATIDVSFYR